jgi:cell cycle arrest protein BUB3
MYEQEFHQLITASWDKEIKFWDSKHTTNINDNINKQENKHKNYIHSLNTNFNITGITLSGYRLIVCGSTDFIENTGYNLNSHIIKIYDIRNLSQSECEKNYESTLKNETRSICTMNTGDGFLMGSNEGRIAVEYFMELEERNSIGSNIIKQSYSFKCHREESETKSLIHAINALAYHPR